MSHFDTILAMALAGEGGGGGSGDFSTATVTVVGAIADITFPSIIDLPDVGLIVNGAASVEEGQYTVPIYKGKCQIIVDVVPEVWTITGDFHQEQDYAYISGDVTFTYTGS